MKRTQRNLFVIMTVMVAFYLILTRLPWQAALAVGAAALLVLAALAIWGRDFFIARRHNRRREWAAAAERYRRFEQRLLKAPWRGAAVVLYLNLYTFDGVAFVRNNIGQMLINAGDLDEAVRSLRAALQSDPQYAVPYVNLAIIAAKRRDETNARREMSRAVQLGYSPVSAQRILRNALEEGSD